MDISSFKKYIKLAPDNVSEWQRWESSLPTFDSILPILDYVYNSEWQRDDWKAIRAFIRKGYLEQNKSSELVGGIKHVNIFNSKIDNVRVDVAISLNCSIVRSLESIDLCSNSVESLSVTHASKLSEITGNIKGLSYLSLNKCQKLDIGSIITMLDSVRILDLSGNPQLSSIDELRGNKNIFALYLVETNVIKAKETVDVLTSMPNLKKIWIKANKNELEILREALPGIVN
jgi:Leucine-rich repeat (LRR) protein